MKTFAFLLFGLTASSLLLAGCTQFGLPGEGSIDLISNAEAQAILEDASPLDYAADSDKRVKIVGTGGGFPDAALGMGDMEMDYVLQLDPDANAASFDIEVSAGFITMDLGMAQADGVVNIRFRDTTYVGRDEKAQDIFEDGLLSGGDGQSAEDEANFNALMSGNFDFLFSEYEGYTVDDVEATEWKGRQAFRILAHADGSGEDYDGARGADGSSAPSGDSGLRDGDGEPDVDAGPVSIEYVVDAKSKRPYFLKSEGPAIDGESPTFEATFSYGNDVDIEVTEDGTRFPFTLNSEERTSVTDDGRTLVEGTVSEFHTEEVKLAEVEMRAVAWSGSSANTWDESDYSYNESWQPPPEWSTSGTNFESYESQGIEYEILAQMRLDQGTLTSGEYAFAYHDNDGDGLVSSGDTYSLEAPADATAQLAFYDLWADAPEGGLAEMMPGFELVALIGAFGAMFLVRRLRFR